MVLVVLAQVPAVPVVLLVLLALVVLVALVVLTLVLQVREMAYIHHHHVPKALHRRRKDLRRTSTLVALGRPGEQYCAAEQHHRSVGGQW